LTIPHVDCGQSNNSQQPTSKRQAAEEATATSVTYTESLL